MGEVIEIREGKKGESVLRGRGDVYDCIFDLQMCVRVTERARFLLAPELRGHRLSYLDSRTNPQSV